MDTLKHESESHASTIAHLESTSRGFVDALNARNLDIKSPAWQHMSPSFIATPDFPIKPPAQRGSWKLSLSEYVGMMGRFMKENNPDHQIQILDMNTQLKVRHAEVFMTTRSKSFFHANMLIDHVAILDFAYNEQEQKWECVKFIGIRGDVGDGDGLFGGGSSIARQ